MAGGTSATRASTAAYIVEAGGTSATSESASLFNVPEQPVRKACLPSRWTIIGLFRTWRGIVRGRAESVGVVKRDRRPSASCNVGNGSLSAPPRNIQLVLGVQCLEGDG